MTGFFLRPARPTDAGRTGAILSAFIDHTDWMPRIHTRAEDLSFAADMIDRGWVTVAETAGTVVGFSAREACMVHALYVDARARGKGCGGALLKQMQRATDTLTLWTFQHNTRAQAFYRHHGFAEMERTDGAGNDEGLPDLRMGWKRGRI
ncbi:GNAT family N-acetyltransferase [Aestuariivita sp.]|uniref:GNAT family N-acetyltransferase n=1 Tax=Aestuariivita sp. TaxID=1872407 RepID=UPI0025C50AEE|nr:GNAT family N-acetyltransferase [Aestuariivita sp.]